MSELVSVVSRIDMRWVLAGLLLALDVWCIGLLSRSGATRRDRWLWIGIILLCPMIGGIFWYVLGPKPDMLRRGSR